jgi:hypothetical protein
MNKNKHNYTDVEQFKDEDGRLKISPETMKLLRPKVSDGVKKKNTINDRSVLGFRAICYPGGKKSFQFRYRPKQSDNAEIGVYNEHVETVLGNYFDPNDKGNNTGITCAVARKLAEELKNKVRMSEDPKSLIAAKKRGKNLKQIADQFLKNRLDRPGIKSSTLKNFTNILNNFVFQKGDNPKHKKMFRTYSNSFKMFQEPMRNLVKDDYIKVHKALTTLGKYQANRVIELLRLVEKYAIEINELDKRVCIFKKEELNREMMRVETNSPYTPEELKRYRRAALELIKEDREMYLVPCYTLLSTSLLGVRSKSQSFCTEWKNVNLKKKTILYTETKNDEVQKVRFDYRFAAILRLMKTVRNEINHRDKRHAFVFPSASKGFKTKHINDPRRTHKSILDRAKLRYLPIHFLRHSWATNSYEATGDLYAVQEMGGWKDIKSVSVYSKMSDRVKDERLAQQRNHAAKKAHVT